MRLEEKLEVQNQLSRSACIIFSDNDIFCDAMNKLFRQRRFDNVSIDIVNIDNLVIADNRKYLDEYELFCEKHNVKEMSIVSIYAAKTMRNTLSGLHDLIQNPSGVMQSVKSVNDSALQLLLEKTSRMGRDLESFQGNSMDDIAISVREISKRNLSILDSLKKTWQGPGDAVQNISSTNLEATRREMTPKWLFRTKLGAQVFIAMEMKTNLILSQSLQTAILQFLLLDQRKVWVNYPFFFFPYFEYIVGITERVNDSVHDLIQNLRYHVNVNNDYKQNEMTIGLVHIPCSSTRQVKTISDFLKKIHDSSFEGENGYLFVSVLFQLLYTYLSIPSFDIPGIEKGVETFEAEPFAYLLISLLDLSPTFPYIASSSSSRTDFFSTCPCFHFNCDISSSSSSSSTVIQFSSPYLVKFIICGDGEITSKLTAQQKLRHAKAFLQFFMKPSESSPASALLTKLLLSESTLAFFNEFDDYFTLQKDNIKPQVNDIYISSSSSSTSSSSSLSSSPSLLTSSSSSSSSKSVFLFVREINGDENMEDHLQGSNMIYFSQKNRSVSFTYEFFYCGEETIKFLTDIRLGDVAILPIISTTGYEKDGELNPFQIELYVSQFDITSTVIKPNSFFYCTLVFSLDETKTPDANLMILKLDIIVGSGKRVLFTDFYALQMKNIDVLYRGREPYNSVMFNPFENNHFLVFLDREQKVEIRRKYLNRYFLDPNGELVKYGESMMDNIVTSSEFVDFKKAAKREIINIVMKDPNTLLQSKSTIANLDKISFIRLQRQLACQMFVLLKIIFGNKLSNLIGKKSVDNLLKLHQNLRSTRFSYLLSLLSQRNNGRYDELNQRNNGLYDELKKWMSETSIDLQKNFKYMRTHIFHASIAGDGKRHHDSDDDDDKDHEKDGDVNKDKKDGDVNKHEKDDDDDVDVDDEKDHEKDGDFLQKRAKTDRSIISCVCVFKDQTEKQQYVFIASKIINEIRLFAISSKSLKEQQTVIINDETITYMSICHLFDDKATYMLAVFSSVNFKINLYKINDEKQVVKKYSFEVVVGEKVTIEDIYIESTKTNEVVCYLFSNNKTMRQKFTYNLVTMTMETTDDMPPPPPPPPLLPFANASVMTPPLDYAGKYICYQSYHNDEDDPPDQTKILFGIRDEYTNDVIYTILNGTDRKLKFRFKDSRQKRNVKFRKDEHFSGKHICLLVGKNVDYILFRTTQHEIFAIYMSSKRYRSKGEKWDETDVIDLALMEQPIEVISSSLMDFKLNQWFFCNKEGDEIQEINPYTHTYKMFRFFDESRGSPLTGGNGKYTLTVLSNNPIQIPSTWKPLSIFSNLFSNHYRFVNNIITGFPQSFPIISVGSTIAEQIHPGYDCKEDIFYYNRSYDDLSLRLVGGYKLKIPPVTTYKKLFNNQNLSLKYNYKNENSSVQSRYQQFKLGANFFYKESDEHDDGTEAKKDGDVLASVLILNLFFFVWESIEFDMSRIKFEQMFFNVHSPHYDAIVVLGNDNFFHVMEKSWFLPYAKYFLENAEFVEKHFKYIRVKRQLKKTSFANGERVMFDANTPFMNSFQIGTYQFDDPYDQAYGFVCDNNGILIRICRSIGHFIISIQKQLVPWLQVGNGKTYDIENDQEIINFHTCLITSFLYNVSLFSPVSLFNNNTNTTTSCRFSFHDVDQQVRMSLSFVELKHPTLIYTGNIWYNSPFLYFDGLTKSFMHYFDANENTISDVNSPRKDFELQDGIGFFIRDCGAEDIENQSVNIKILVASCKTSFKEMEHSDNDELIHEVPITKFQRYDPPVLINYENDIDLNLKLLAHLKDGVSLSSSSSKEVSKIKFYSEGIYKIEDDDDDDDKRETKGWDLIPNLFDSNPKLNLVKKNTNLFVQVSVNMMEVKETFRFWYCFYRFALPNKKQAVLSFFFTRLASSTLTPSSIWKCKYISINHFKKIVALTNPWRNTLLQLASDDALGFFKEKIIYLSTCSIVRVFGVQI